jgi:hypothetical protein
MRAIGVLILAVCVGACGGASGGAGGGTGPGPDTSAVKQHLLETVNGSAGGQARFTEFKESGRKQEGSGDSASCTISYEGEVEFTGPCEFNGLPRKAGDRATFEAEVEFIQDESGWKQGSAGFYPH